MGTALADLRALVTQLTQRRVQARPTRAGVIFGVMLVGVVGAAVNTGNNLLYLVLGSLCATLVLSSILAEWNLRGVRVRRRLPPEAFAGEAATGAFLVENRRRLGGAWALRLTERAGDAATEAGVAEARVVRVGPGETVEIPARWVFTERGAVQLRGVVLESSFPFGLVRRWRLLPLAGALVVWPAPARGPRARRSPGAGAIRPNRHRRGREADFRGLRPYVPGDPLRDLHWPTTARLGAPVVVLRDGQQAEQVLIELADVQGEHWETELSRATGQVQLHFHAGRAVGLRIEGTTHPPRTSDAWRRRLLAALALAPRRGGFAR